MATSGWLNRYWGVPSAEGVWDSAENSVARSKLMLRHLGDDRILPVRSTSSLESEA